MSVSEASDAPGDRVAGTAWKRECAVGIVGTARARGGESASDG